MNTAELWTIGKVILGIVVASGFIGYLAGVFMRGAKDEDEE